MGTMGTWGREKRSALDSLLRPPDVLAREEGVAGLGSAAQGEAVITWACTARWKAPRLKGSMEPLWFLVPSGKTQTRTCRRQTHAWRGHTMVVAPSPYLSVYLQLFYSLCIIPLVPRGTHVLGEQGLGDLRHDTDGIPSALPVDEDDSSQPAGQPGRASPKQLPLGDGHTSAGQYLHHPWGR